MKKLISKTAAKLITVSLLISALLPSQAGAIILIIPSISNLSVAQTPHVWSKSGDLKINFQYENLSSNATVDIKIFKKSDVNDVALHNGNPNLVKPAGAYAFSWDGFDVSQLNLATDGTYVINISGKDGQINLGPLVRDIYVQKNLPVLTSISASKSYFYPDKSETVDFVSNYSNAAGGILSTINAKIYSSKDPAKNAIWDNSKPIYSPGQVSFNWNGHKKSDNSIAPPDTYFIEIGGTYGIYSIESKIAAIEVKATSPVPPPVNNTCAGYQDLSLNDADCAAFTYAKGIGAITGEGNGSLVNPDGIYQRDQSAKVSSIVNNLFVSGTNYCKSQNPFPDITSKDWSYQYVCRLKDLGIITGYKSGPYIGLFVPANSVNRYEFLALILRGLSDSMPSIYTASYNDVPTGEWFSGFSAYSKNLNLFSGINLSGNKSVIRREVAQVIYKLHQNGKI